jgi:hypothetical protein
MVVKSSDTNLFIICPQLHDLHAVDCQPHRLLLGVRHLLLGVRHLILSVRLLLLGVRHPLLYVLGKLVEALGRRGLARAGVLHVRRHQDVRRALIYCAYLRYL